MAGPAYRLIGYVGSSAPFGSAPFGTSSFGGGRYPLYTVPPLNYTSDDLATKKRRVVAGVTHERLGVVIGSKTWTNRARWRVVHRAISSADVDSLYAFYEARRFELIPDGDPDQSTIYVYWKTPEFSPTKIRGGRFHMEYELEESN